MTYEISEAHRRAADALRRGSNLDDADIDLLVAAWKSGEDTESVAVVVEAMTRMVLKKLPRSNGWLAHRREECAADARVWVMEALAEYRPGAGSVAAMIATRRDWIVARLVQDHSQGAGTLDRSLYQLRAAAWAERARLRELTGREPDLETLKNATWERMVAEKVEREIAAGADPVSARGRAVASLKRSGKHAALAQLSNVLNMGDADHSLDQPVRADGVATLGSTLVDAESDSTSEGYLEQLYHVALGDEEWARPALAGRFGALGAVEGRGALGDLDPVQLNGSRGMSIIQLAKSTGRDRNVVRAVITGAVNRLGAPHAHWSHLAVSVVVSEPAVGALAGFDRSAFADN
jgi:hypothetical protein